MIKLILVNVLLMVLCLVAFIFMAAGIEYALGSGKHVLLTALIFFAVLALHLWVNLRLLKKWELASPRNNLVSAMLIACVYMIYLIYLLSN